MFSSKKGRCSGFDGSGAFLALVEDVLDESTLISEEERIRPVEWRAERVPVLLEGAPVVAV